MFGGIAALRLPFGLAFGRGHFVVCNLVVLGDKRKPEGERNPNNCNLVCENNGIVVFLQNRMALLSKM